MLFALLLEQLVGDVIVEDSRMDIDQFKLALDALLPKVLRDIFIQLLDLPQTRHENQH